jgi:ABC-type ATPase involved in cell division
LKINWNAATETVRNISFSKQNRPVFSFIAGNSGSGFVRHIAGAISFICQKLSAWRP